MMAQYSALKAGHRVAIAEQTKSPAAAKVRGSKSIVSRRIVRVVTAGTLTGESLLEARPYKKKSGCEG
jgi:DNA mismatch repair protein MutS